MSHQAHMFSHPSLLDDRVGSNPSPGYLSSADELLLRSSVSTLDAILSGSVTSSESTEVLDLEEIDISPGITGGPGNP